VEANDPRLEAELVRVVETEPLGEKLLPPVGVLRVGGVSDLLA
jgi:hypothetical protein